MDMMIRSKSNCRRFIIGNNNNNMERRQDQDTSDNHNPTASSCTSENGSESPPSTAIFHDFSKTNNNKNNINNNIATNSSASTISKKSSTGRRSAQKRVVTIPIKEIEGLRSLKGESCHTSTPPSDSWAWRKYGQKPIKGSPYPRGYYRCSSSKGCPARKQVERSRVDPTMLLVTYSAEHNHPWPTASSRNHHHPSPAATSSRPPQKPAVKEEEEEAEEEEEEDREMITGGGPGARGPEPEEAHESERFVGLVGDDFGWFGDHMDHHHHTAALQSPVVFAAADGSGGACESLAAVFPMGEEDESLFADLGELPECSLVFRHRRAVGPQVEIF